MSETHSGMETTQALIARIRAGEEGARDRLMHRFLPGLRRWARGRLPDHARGLVETNDLVQVTLLRALGRIHEFDHGREGAFLAYLHRILINCLRDEVRRARVRPGSTTEEDLPDTRPAILERTLGPGAVASYENALRRLPAETQQAVVLRIEFNFSFPEIAEALGKDSANTVRMQVTRALVRIAEWMDEPA